MTPLYSIYLLKFWLKPYFSCPQSTYLLSLALANAFATSWPLRTPPLCGKKLVHLSPQLPFRLHLLIGRNQRWPVFSSTLEFARSSFFPCVLSIRLNFYCQTCKNPAYSLPRSFALRIRFCTKVNEILSKYAPLMLYSVSNPAGTNSGSSYPSLPPKCCIHWLTVRTAIITIPQVPEHRRQLATSVLHMERPHYNDFLNFPNLLPVLKNEYFREEGIYNVAVNSADPETQRQYFKVVWRSSSIILDSIISSNLGFGITKKKGYRDHGSKKCLTDTSAF